MAFALLGVKMNSVTGFMHADHEQIGTRDARGWRRARRPAVVQTGQSGVKRQIESQHSKPSAPEARPVSAVNTEIRQEANAVGGVGSPTTAASAELPILDTDTFDRWTTLLAPEKIEDYLDTMVEFRETNLTGGRPSFPSQSNGNAPRESAHKLAGSAGMFGLRRVESLSRCYEQALETDGADVKTIADSLRAAITVTHEEIRGRLRLATLAKK